MPGDNIPPGYVIITDHGMPPHWEGAGDKWEFVEGAGDKATFVTPKRHLKRKQQQFGEPEEVQPGLAIWRRVKYKWEMWQVPVGCYVAWKINYIQYDLDKAVFDKKVLPKFRYGKVTDLHPKKDTATVHYYHAAKDYGQYRPWRDAATKLVEVPLHAFLHVTAQALTGTGLIPCRVRNCIKEQMKAWLMTGLN
jgi:hypothetical protein